MPEPFGSFGWICRNAPLPQCNLFFSQLWREGSSSSLQVLFPSTSDFFSNYSVSTTSHIRNPNVQLARKQAGNGVGMSCVIPLVTERDSLGDIVTVIMLFISILLSTGLITHGMRRVAALGRKEMSLLIGGYALMSALGAVTTTSMLEQGSMPLMVLSAIHCAIMAALPWFLVQNALVSTDILEDGTPLSVYGTLCVSIATFAATLYVSIATGLDSESVFRFADDGPGSVDLVSYGLFVLTLIWPAVAIVAYLSIMTYIIVTVTCEQRQLVYLGAATFLFIAGQLCMFLASQPLCEATNSRINGAFLTAILNNGALLAMYAMWLFITEDEWDDLRWPANELQPMPMVASGNACY